MDTSVANEIITPEDRVKIENFYDSNTFILKGKEAVETLRFAIPDIVETKYDSEKDLYFMRVEKWPYIKQMCLKFARSKPCYWKYVTKDNRTVFEYYLDTHTIKSHV